MRAAIRRPLGGISQPIAPLRALLINVFLLDQANFIFLENFARRSPRKRWASLPRPTNRKPISRR